MTGPVCSTCQDARYLLDEEDVAHRCPDCNPPPPPEPKPERPPPDFKKDARWGDGD